MNRLATAGRRWLIAGLALAILAAGRGSNAAAIMTDRYLPHPSCPGRDGA